MCIRDSIKSETRYQGRELLTVRRHGKAMRYTAKVNYVRNDQGAESDAVADFVSDLLPTGEQLDSADHDPDYLTVLNQPFSAQLDVATLEDLKRCLLYTSGLCRSGWRRCPKSSRSRRGSVRARSRHRSRPFRA